MTTCRSEGPLLGSEPGLASFQPRASSLSSMRFFWVCFSLSFLPTFPAYARPLRVIKQAWLVHLDGSASRPAALEEGCKQGSGFTLVAGHEVAVAVEGDRD